MDDTKILAGSIEIRVEGSWLNAWLVAPGGGMRTQLASIRAHFARDPDCRALFTRLVTDAVVASMKQQVPGAVGVEAVQVAGEDGTPRRPPH